MPSDRLEEKERKKQLEQSKGRRWKDAAKKLSEVDLTDQEWKILEPLIPRSLARRTSAYHRYAGSDQRHPVPGSHGREISRLAARFPTLGNRVELFPKLSRRWDLEAHPHSPARKDARESRGREPTPSAAIIDSQSVKTSQKGGGAETSAANA
jgi:putative transposase